MAVIIKGTTPTITYTFRTISPPDIVKAYLTVRQINKTIFEKNLSEATVGENSLSWELSQEDTFALRAGEATVRLNWKTSDGTRGASAKGTITVEDNEKNEVI